MKGRPDTESTKSQTIARWVEGLFCCGWVWASDLEMRAANEWSRSDKGHGRQGQAGCLAEHA